MFWGILGQRVLPLIVFILRSETQLDFQILIILTEVGEVYELLIQLMITTHPYSNIAYFNMGKQLQITGMIMREVLYV
jgi:hypothetical protein